MPTVKTCESVMGENWKAIRRLRVLVLALAVAVLGYILAGCGGSEAEQAGYSANGCYCLEGFRLAQGEGLEAQARAACSMWPDWGYIREAFDAFVQDPAIELYCEAEGTFSVDEVQGYLDAGWRVSMNYPTVPESECNAPEGENCNHFEAVRTVEQLRGDVEWLCVAGDFSRRLDLSPKTP